METTHVLIAVPAPRHDEYQQYLSAEGALSFQLVSDIDSALAIVADTRSRVDVFVLDYALGQAHQIIRQLRQSYPRLLIILVDESADFGLPGQADEFTNAPLSEDGLVKRINKLIFERKQETLRSDSLPAIREISQSLRKASGMMGKQQAAVDTVLNMEYDYVAYYHFQENQALLLTAQAGPKPIAAVAPKTSTPDDLMTWVMQNGQSRIANYGDALNHPLVAKGRLGAVACVPVAFDNKPYGVLVACRERPNSINQEHVMMLELVCAQLGSFLMREGS